MDASQRRTAAFGRMETEKAMKEYTPSEKSTEELREYIAKLTEESEHMTEWPDVDIVVNDEVGQQNLRAARMLFFYPSLLYRIRAPFQVKKLCRSPPENTGQQKTGR